MTPKQLKSARKRLGLTQAKLAERLGIATNHLYLMESGRSPVREVYALAIEALIRRL